MSESPTQSVPAQNVIEASDMLAALGHGDRTTALLVDTSDLHSLLRVLRGEGDADDLANGQAIVRAVEDALAAGIR